MPSVFKVGTYWKEGIWVFESGIRNRRLAGVGLHILSIQLTSPLIGIHRGFIADKHLLQDVCDIVQERC